MEVVELAQPCGHRAALRPLPAPRLVLAWPPRSSPPPWVPVTPARCPGLQQETRAPVASPFARGRAGGEAGWGSPWLLCLGQAGAFSASGWALSLACRQCCTPLVARPRLQGPLWTKHIFLKKGCDPSYGTLPTPCCARGCTWDPLLGSPGAFAHQQKCWQGGTGQAAGVRAPDAQAPSAQAPAGAGADSARTGLRGNEAGLPWPWAGELATASRLQPGPWAGPHPP